MPVTKIIQPDIFCKQQVENHRRDPNYWRSRRELLARYKARVGCDWPGIARTILAVDEFLDRLRRKRGAA